MSRVALFKVAPVAPEGRGAFIVSCLLAAVLIVGSVSLVRYNAARLWLIDPDQSVWRLPLET